MSLRLHYAVLLLYVQTMAHSTSPLAPPPLPLSSFPQQYLGCTMLSRHTGSYCSMSKRWLIHPPPLPPPLHLSIGCTMLSRHTGSYCSMSKRWLIPPPPSIFRLHYAVQAYRELLLYVQEMGRSGEEAMRENAKVMQSNVFYHPEYRDVFVTLLR